MRDLVYTVLAEYHLQPDPACTDADLRDIEQSYFQRGGAFYVLETQNGSLIGSYGLYPLATPDASSVGAGPRACPDDLAPVERAGNHGGLPPPACHATPDTCELRKMYLHRDYRGQGHGKRMLEHALAQARDLGFRKITLETASALKEAIHLYESYGFVRYQPTHLSPRCDQAYMLELR